MPFPAFSRARRPGPSFVPSFPATPANDLVAVGPPHNGRATHYGVTYNGSRMGCGGYYDSSDTTIIAVAPSRYSDWPCGTLLQVCGDDGCILGVRQDACPGCGAYQVDLSEDGIAAVCGDGASVCDVTIQVMGPSAPPPDATTPDP